MTIPCLMNHKRQQAVLEHVWRGGGMGFRNRWATKLQDFCRVFKHHPPKRTLDLPDHPAEEQDNEMHSELAEHGKQLERKDGVLRDREIVDEGTDEHNATEAACCGH